MVRGFARELYSDPGVRTAGMIQADVMLGPKKYWNNFATPNGFVFRALPGATSYYQQLLERARSIPGVEGAAIATRLPQEAREMLSFNVLGRPEPSEGEEPQTAFVEVDSELLRLLEIPVLRGRGITQQDRDGTPWVAVVNETFANRYFPDEDPLGRDVRITLGRTTSGTIIREPQSRRIVGVVANVRKSFYLRRPPAVVYSSYLQYPPEYPPGGRHGIHTTKKLLLETSLEPRSLIPSLRRAAAEIDPDQALFNIRTLEQALADPLAGPRFTVQMVSLFAFLALVLAAVGVYGVSSYSVNARWQEFGIRRALGAQKGDLRRLSLTHVLKPALLGMVLGLGGVVALQKVFEAMPFGFRTDEFGTFLVACFVMLAVVFAAGYLPARRATKVDPLSALRCE
jgi:putative ABC transport system permease protein